MNKMHSLLLCTLFAALPLSAQKAVSPSAAPLPPMGWNSWNYFADKVDDKGIRQAAD